MTIPKLLPDFLSDALNPFIILLIIFFPSPVNKSQNPSLKRLKLLAYFLGGSNSQTLSPALLAISPLTSVGYSGVPLFASACILSIIPPLILALYFQKFISNLNFVDPVTTKIS